MLNAIVNGGFNAKAEKVSITNGLKSTGWDVRLQVLVHNRRGEPVYWWWVDYFGNPVLYGVISPWGWHSPVDIWYPLKAHFQR